MFRYLILSIGHAGPKGLSINPRSLEGVGGGGWWLKFTQPLDLFGFTGLFGASPITKSFGKIVLCLLTHLLTLNR